jgi:CRISPR type III-A-associated RAMP protein Csm4
MKKKFDCIKLHLKSPLHISRGRSDYDKSLRVLHSDTIAAALYVAAKCAGYADQEILKTFDSIRLSSAYPFASDNFFFPRPMARIDIKIADLPLEKYGKKIKGIKYMEQSIFERVLHGEQLTLNDSSLIDQKGYLAEKDMGVVFEANVVQRVAVAPDNYEDARPFYTERLFFNQDSGLYVLAEWTGSFGRELFRNAFRLLGDQGIGTDRSVGNGFFEPEFQELSLRVPQNPTNFCNLGLYLPEAGELSDDDFSKSNWSLIKRGGFMSGAEDFNHTSMRKRSIFMFEEGSIFPYKTLNGTIVDLKPDNQGVSHPVWREGRPLFVPIIKI